MVDRTVAIPKRALVVGGTLRKADGEGDAVEIREAPVLVGRDERASMVLSDKEVSSLHAELTATEQGVRVRDLGSRNGTWVDDTRLVEGFLTQPCSLWLGGVELHFEPRKPSRLELPADESFGDLHGSSPAMRKLFGQLRRIAKTDVSVLVLGETGTGKELVAQALHKASPRAKAPFVVVDCGAIPPTLAESTLFGHERGAFTGAVQSRTSPFVEANGGTLFLDELGELPIDVQPKLLRVLAERRVKTVGGNQYRDIDVRVLAATRRDLRRSVNDGSFRSDLFFRIAQLTVEICPLRERLGDIPGLVKHMFREAEQARAFRRVPALGLEKLMRHDWPGNVRELRSAVTVALAMAEDSGPIDPSMYVGHLGSSVRASVRPNAEQPRFRDAKSEILARFEKDYFAELSTLTDGNVSEMARLSGLERAHVRRYLRRYGLAKR